MSIIDFYKNNSASLDKNEILLIMNNKHILAKYNEITNRIYKHTYYKNKNTSYLVGTLFFISKKYNIMKKYYKYSIKKGHVNAMNNIGYYYKNITKNYNKAIKYYLMAITNGDSDAMYNLGCHYCDIAKDYNNAIKYYLMAITNGDSDAMYNLGNYYSNIAKDYNNAKKYYLMAIDNGDAHAMNNLGCYYRTITKDHELTVKYYLMAIDKGNVVAMNNLNIMMKENNIDVLLILLNINNKSKFVQETILSMCSCPKLKYISDQYEIHHLNLKECTICFNNEKFIIKTTCQHEMCYECFVKLYNNACPFCRTNIEIKN